MKPRRRVLNCGGRFPSRPFSEVCLSLLWSWPWEWGRKHLYEKQAKFVVTGQFPSACLKGNETEQTSCGMCAGLQSPGGCEVGGRTTWHADWRCREANLCGHPHGTRCLLLAWPSQWHHDTTMTNERVTSYSWLSNRNKGRMRDEKETSHTCKTINSNKTKTQWRKMATTRESLY